MFSTKKRHVILLIVSLIIICSCNNKSKEKLSPVEITVCLGENQLRVDYFLHDIDSRAVSFVLPKKVPGTYEAMVGKYITNINAFNANNEKIDIESKSENEYVINNAKKLKKISYTIQRSRVSTDNILSAGVIIDKSLLVINAGVSFGYIDQYKEAPYNVTIYNSSIKQCISSHLISKNDSTFHFKFKDYDDLVDNPIIFSSQSDSIGFSTIGRNIKISTHTPHNKINSTVIKSILAPTINAVFKELNFIQQNNYQLIFIFNNVVDQSIMDYAALEHKGSSIYYLFSEPNLSDRADSLQFAFFLKKIVAHEIFHLFTPLDFKDNTLEPYQYNNLNMSEHLWMYEGFVEYYSLKILLSNGLISQKEFLDEMSRKMLPLNWHYGSGYMLDNSKNVFKDSSPFKSFYSHGAICSFLLDVMTINKSNGQYDLFHILKDYYAMNRVFNPDSLINFVTRSSDASLKRFLVNYRLDIQPDELSSYFNLGGLCLKSSSKTCWYSFFIEKYYHNEQLNFMDIHFQKELKGLASKDIRVVKINGQSINSHSVGLLYNRLYSPRKIQINYFENGVEKSNSIEQEGFVVNQIEIQQKERLTAKDSIVLKKLKIIQ